MENTQPIIAAGGTQSALDMSSEDDRAMVREAMKRWPKRWRGLSDDRKEGFISGLTEAGAVARQHLNSDDPGVALDAAKAVSSIVKTAVQMEAQIQADDHLQDKNARLDDGKATERIAVDPVVLERPVTKPAQLE